MRKIFISAILLTHVLWVCAQQLSPDSTRIRQDLLQKSKSQKTTAFILLGAGAVAVVAGSLIFEQNFNIWDDGNGDAAGSGVILATAGGLSMLGSIPFFIASSSNKKKAANMTAGIKAERTLQSPLKQGYAYYPAISLKWQIR